MLKNYLIIALRNLQKHKTISLINLSGLTLGIVCALSIFLWTKRELSFDRFHYQYPAIYRLAYNENYMVKTFSGHIVGQHGLRI